MIDLERYIVAVDGSPTDALGLRRLEAVAVSHSLMRAAGDKRCATIAIHEQVTGEARACWVRSFSGWQVLSVAEWLS